MSKGGGKQHTPYEKRDNLKSTQELSVIDVISEGPVEGPVNGLQGLRLNDTPVTDAQGGVNIHGVRAEWRSGEEEQTPLTGFDGSASETIISAEVTHDKPITRTITSEYVDRLRVTAGVQALVRTTGGGDRVGDSVEMSVQIQRGGVWSTEQIIVIDGKRTSPFMTSVILDDLPPRPFNLRVVRVTPDSTSDTLQNKTVWQGLTEIINITQSYPDTALVGLKVDADQFGSQSVSRKFHLRGRIVRVPSNYDPAVRTYTGLWDGSFKPAWTNNPAWQLLDLLTHPRYGLGQRLGLADVDKWALYGIAQYCDQPVPDGSGGTEPRITCNAYLAERRRAYDVISDFCSVMRCMPVWNGQRMTFIQDRPSDKVWTYTNANVVNGRFDYSYSAAKDRHNAAEVRFVDPVNGWNVSVELVEDKADIQKNGRKVVQTDAFGCTSRGQAHRTGLWVIQTALLETQMVSFSTGAEGLRHTPGDIFEICDNDYAGASVGGRITAADAATRSLTLDRDIELPGTGSAVMSFIGHDGNSLSASVISQPGKNRVILNSLPEGVAEGSVWGLKLPALRRRLFRCTAIQEKEDGTYAVSALQHVPEKEAVVDRGAAYEPESGTLNSVIPPAVQHLAVDTSADSSLYLAKAEWDTPRVIKGVRFLLRLTTGAGTEEDPVRLVTTATTTGTEYTFRELPYGHYTLAVSAINGYGQQGNPVSAEFDIDLPEPPDFIEITPGYFSLTVAPRQKVHHPEVSFEFRFSEKRLMSAEQVLAEGQYLGRGTMWIVQGRNMKAGHRYYVYVRSVNVVGKSIFVEASGIPESNADEILDAVQKELEDSKIIQELSNNDMDSFEAIINNANSQYGQWMHQQRENGAMKAEIIRVDNYVVTETKALAEHLDAVQATADKSLARAQNSIKAEYDMEKGTASAIWKSLVSIVYDGVNYDTGMVIGAEMKGGEVNTLIGFNAQKFAFYNPVNGKMDLFMYAKGGQMFIREAFINQAWLNEVVVTDKMQSENYVPGKAGFLIDAKTGKTEINGSDASGGRMEIKNDQIRVWDEKGRLRVEIGRLTG